MNLDRPGLFEGHKMLLATVTDVESLRVEKLANSQVKSEIHAILSKVYANATLASGTLYYTFLYDNSAWYLVSPLSIGFFRNIVVEDEGVILKHI